MKAEKITLTITAEALSADTFPSLLNRLADQVANEFLEGSLTAEDGDVITWSISKVQVYF
jgi:ABC-type phosphate transport system ATPase subunit